MYESDELNDLKKELEEVRQLKESLRAEIDELRNSKPKRRERRMVIEPPVVDLSGVIEGLEDIMESVGEQIQESLSEIPGIERRARARRYVRPRPSPRRRSRNSEVEMIPPERVARYISPLGSEERLRILDYLKSGGKTFNDLEQHTGRTGSSLTHHLNPLVDAGYVIKGEVRGTYYVTVEGRLAYRLAQWLTSRLEGEIKGPVNSEETELDMDDDHEDWF
jgi:DNA-binding transcriptional ArsR family regulator